MVHRRLCGALVAVASILVAASCTGSDSGPAAASTSTDPPDAVEDRTTPDPTRPEPRPEPSFDDIEGLIAATGSSGLRILRPNGDVVAEFAGGSVVRQPTWSRDGSRLAATVIDPATGLVDVAIVDTATWEIERQPAVRPYFFYSWSHDASLVAALGPAAGLGGTAVDILDETGTPASNSTMVGGSMFIAWEPGGREILLHANDQMRVITDISAVESFTDFGTTGASFQAASWIPGTRDFLYVDSTGSESRLVRRTVDTGATVDLGAVTGFTFVSVDPQGGRAAISHGRVAPSDDEPDVILASFQPADALTVEIVDLASGDRTPVLDALGIWLEWSPDGSQLLTGTPVPGGLTWHVWAESGGAQELGTFTPTDAFRQSYVPFADQYVETPRLWSPDGRAITFGALLGGEATAVTILTATGEMRELATADVSFFSPVDIRP